jgi:hypothetical protein
VRSHAARSTASAVGGSGSSGSSRGSFTCTRSRAGFGLRRPSRAPSQARSRSCELTRVPSSSQRAWRRGRRRPPGSTRRLACRRARAEHGRASSDAALSSKRAHRRARLANAWRFPVAWAPSPARTERANVRETERGGFAADPVPAGDGVGLAAEAPTVSCAAEDLEGRAGFAALCELGAVAGSDAAASCRRARFDG